MSKHSESPLGFFTVRLSPEEYEKLERLAIQTDHSKGAVIRTLLKLSNIPEAIKLLGKNGVENEHSKHDLSAS